MSKFLLALATVSLLVSTSAIAAESRYCNIDSCLKSCMSRGGTGKGCPKYCNDKNREASAAGKCKS